MTELKNPTVKDIIEYLSQFPDDAPFRIEDPDTNWTINIIDATQDTKGIVWLTGSYDEMNTGPEEVKTE